MDKLNIGFIIQVDTLCHKLPNFVAKCALAGVRRVFIGLEKHQSGQSARRQEAVKQDYRIPHERCSPGNPLSGVITYAGYILGFPNDTLDSILHDIDVIKRELPVDLLEFFYLTPLPGSEDHLKLVHAGVALDPDMNKYDLNHVCTTHPRMSRTGVGPRVQACLAALLYNRPHRDDSAPRGVSGGQCKQRAVPDHVV